MRVLWLDDEPTMVAPYLMVFRERGHVVELASSVDELEGMLESSMACFDVAVIDVMIPSGHYNDEETSAGLDTGLLAARGLRAEHPELPIIVLTNRTDVGRLRGEYAFTIHRKADLMPWD